MIERIVMGYDFSEPADDALSWTVDLARALGARVTLVHVMESADEGDPVVTARREDLARVADDLGPEVASRLLLGTDVAQTLVDYADTFDADLVVVSSAGLGGVARWLLGSVADAVVRKAHCPVVTVRDQD